MDPEHQEALAAFHAFDETIASRDVEATLALFADDDDVTFWGSGLVERAVGREELRSLIELIVGLPVSFVMEVDEQRVRVVGDVAWVSASGTATFDQGDGMTSRLPYRSVAILVRRDGRWLWHTFLGSEPSQFELPG